MNIQMWLSCELTNYDEIGMNIILYTYFFPRRYIATDIDWLMQIFWGYADKEIKGTIPGAYVIL